MRGRPVIDSETGAVDRASDLTCATCGASAIERHRPGCTVLLSPVHVDEVPSREAALDYAREWTKGERPIVVHRGSFADIEHTATNDLAETMSCPCGPDLER